MSEVSVKSTVPMASLATAERATSGGAAVAVSSNSRSVKSKKKKGGGGGANGQGENTGRWTAEEHRLFLQGLEQHGKGWKKIASLIKSRTVVQIRTHAQKYFQKLAKARQNGEEGEVTMEGRGGLSTTGGNSVTGIGGTAPPTKRRRPLLAGTKRKVISSVVHSAQKQGKKMAMENQPPPLPAVAPALANFVVPIRDKTGFAPNPSTQGTVSGPTLEDSIFRFLTPAPVASSDSPVLNEIARQAGAHPITLPSENPSSAPTTGSGEGSPTGVAEISIYPSWTDDKDPPSWYAKGADVDALLDVAGSLDWLADSGDPNENFHAPEIEGAEDIPEVDVSPSKIQAEPRSEEVDHHAVDDIEAEEDHHHFRHDEDEHHDRKTNHHLATISSSAELPQTMDDSNMDEQVPPLPSFFDGEPNADEHYEDVDTTEEIAVNHKHSSNTYPSGPVPSNSASDLLLTANPSSSKLTLHDDDHGTSNHDSHHSVDGELGDATLFDSEMEHDFVSTILENESAVDLAALHD